MGHAVKWYMRAWKWPWYNQSYKSIGPLRFAATSGLLTILEQEVGTSAVSFREQMCIY